ncbi:metallophosphoesterase [uncultured Clostridium sp.]|uniref:metallophosphoesterase n=1 Tax=uncultured Clostridium sp. TaxID=59620 RepID=UPI002639B47B|nr:metallophosphoesterase [uncultured Clostridium sp.]
MEIIVVSDTHNNTNAIEKILEISKNSDIIFHLGDNIADAKLLQKEFHGKVHMVKGNCDYGEEGLNEEIVEVHGKRFFLTHGDRYGVNYGLDKLYYRGLEVKADCILYGHTHRKLKLIEEGIYIINPGSLPLPRDNSSSYARINFDETNNITIKLIEL